VPMAGRNTCAKNAVVQASVFTGDPGAYARNATVRPFASMTGSDTNARIALQAKI